MKKQLALAFARGIGGGLAIAATPWVVTGITMLVVTSGLAWHRTREGFEDAGDAVRYWNEMRVHRKRVRAENRATRKGKHTYAGEDLSIG